MAHYLSVKISGCLRLSYSSVLYLNDNSCPNIINCRILRNSSVGGTYYSSYGGGVSFENSHAMLRNCVISGNSTIGEMYHIGHGGAIYTMDSFPVISNCVISRNSANNGGGFFTFDYDTTAVFSNSIFWLNIPDKVMPYYGQPIITYSDIKGGYTGEGNFDKDPLFVDPNTYNFHLKENSPCIDAGDPVSDVPWGGGFRIDLGANEFFKGFNCIANCVRSEEFSTIRGMGSVGKKIKGSIDRINLEACNSGIGYGFPYRKLSRERK